jgi:enoyl-CoA hydratase/carnithine racemase
MSDSVLLREAHDGVLLLRLNRPEKLNALSPELAGALLDALEEAGRDPGVRCLVLAGSGRAFCAGGDLTALLAMGTDEFRAFIELLQRLSAAMRGLGKPSIAAINGHTLAGGLELALECDLRVASEQARFGLPDASIGLTPTGGLTYLLPRVVGLGWAKHLALTEEVIDARQALAIGLVTRVVPAEQLEATALQLARTLAGHPPTGLRLTRQLLDLGLDADLHHALAQEVEAEMACFATEEVQAHLRAFAERRRQKQPAAAPPGAPTEGG